jgi:hypothetical protein
MIIIFMLCILVHTYHGLSPGTKRHLGYLTKMYEEYLNVQSTARQTIQNCQTSPLDFQRYSRHNKAQI